VGEIMLLYLVKVRRTQ